MTDATTAGPGRRGVVGRTVRRLSRSTLAWAGAGFVGFLLATALTPTVPAVADWQSALICGSGTHLGHVAYASQGGATLPDGSPAPASSTSNTAFRCSGPHSVSGSRTVLVLSVQFIAGTLVTYLLIGLLAIRGDLRRE